MGIRLNVILSGIFVIALGGCQFGNQGISVIVDGDSPFPAQMAGRWTADGKDMWAFQFEKDGTVSWCAIGMGGTEMRPGRTTTFPARHSGKGIFKPGPWTVRYAPATRELNVEIVIDHFHLDTQGGNALEGSLTDVLVGVVSEDYETWEADWFGKETLTGFTPEPKTFSDIKELEFKKKVVFKKVTEGQD